jgi:hypothetical protein
MELNMRMRRLLFSGIILLLFSALPMHEPMAQPDDLRELVKELQQLLVEQRAKGVDVSKASELDELSRKAFAAGKKEETAALLRQAISLLRQSAGVKNEQTGQTGFTAPAPVVKAAAQVEGIFNDSPFGIFGPYQFKLDSSDVMTKDVINSYLLDVGATWVQVMPLDIESVPGKISIYSRVGREGGVQQPQIDYEKYKSALQHHIEKYRNRVKYYEVDTEPGGLKPPMGWKGYPKEYAEFLKVTYKTVKSVCPDCQIVMNGGLGIGRELRENDQNVAFLKDILDAGSVGYFDVFAIKQHHYVAGDYVFIKDKMKVYGKVLSAYGIDIKKIPVFLETATYAGNPNYPEGNPLSFIHFTPQTEAQQAAALVKIYIYSLAQGVSKIFWNEIFERHNMGGAPGNPFNFYGLVANPLNPLNSGQSHKKLAYYTFKKMVETLEGSAWKSMQTLQESDGIYLYKVFKMSRPLWVAWNDNPEQRRLSITGINSRRVKIVYLVPNGSSGKDVKDYATAFTEEAVIIPDRSVNLNLADMPVLIEELE